ncbi:MAG: polyribonucleotide nucleotidyltransferase [Candidatus Buchananbacteria bacterium RIFCSPHIGHO2_02_FULL_40_13]|uniref:Polyribonucleotide nucleotidyltransferase n=1 Tax=Candidatus Buchananbacteria bacterium RIFCSPLOWO2_01_FULL_39_33 TaxID=1797543 RepID=A0A1G1YFY8_9BACT|nr:MAG: polyribonucleotide nucleotidyltransferase [Candidatus Buchananbacteria bacterium RIFCSPHIGHO2_02_FULL_40_13]OGY51268.1 MAG: polyribonucleotide nucleotidyltransferase [Candidatus Buchananbacteria bacterium RIFCSPLOWO2_01_FULL_39_33]
MLKQKSFELDFAGRQLSVEVGKLAKQVNAACVVKYGETVVLATAVMSQDVRVGIDFFPLQIEVREKMYAAGKIKGSKFIKGEGRPTDTAILAGRMVDRGLRPLFNQAIRNEVQVVLTSLSYDKENSFDLLSITAASIALHISDIPWQGPLVGINVGRIGGEFVVNPTEIQKNQSDLNLVISVANNKVVMIDADGQEVSEDDLVKAIAFGLEQTRPLLAFIEKIRSEVGLVKQDANKLIEDSYAGLEIPLSEKQATWAEAKEFFIGKLDKYLFNRPIGTKRERKAAAQVVLDEFVWQLEEQVKHEEIIKYVKDNFEAYLEEVVAAAILEKSLRIDGRRLEQIRPLASEVSLLPRTHGSGLFSRGETQVLTTVTLGAPGEVMLQDEMTEDETKKRYMHFYNCPSYSFGETGPFRGAGRREIGHGALAEKALLPVLPAKEDFPYTIVTVSEVMGSNGSSSMASTCGSTLALMDAGVPLKKPVAGIAMGLASQGDKYKILTDLQDLEDGAGGMDFKVTGTKDGITAIQMDTKTAGLTLAICQATLAQAKAARLEILENMVKTIAQPRAELSQYAPRIIAIKIDPEKIGAVIGTGGKIINEIIEVCGVQVDIDDDGTVSITGVGDEGILKAKDWVEKLTKEVEVGEIYDGQVVRLMDFGAFVEILPGKDGLVHISEFSNERVDKITDVAKIGQPLKVKVIEIDSQGRINLSVKQADPNYKPIQRDYRDDHSRFKSGGPSRDRGFRNDRGGNRDRGEKRGFGFRKR